MIVAALLASAYPAIVALRVRPAQALHSGKVPPTKQHTLRIIVSAQCVAASLLLVLTSIMHDQTNAVRHATIAATDDVIISLGNNLNAAGVDRSLLQNELRSQPHLISVSAIDNAPGAATGRARIVMLGAKSSASSLLVSAPWIDYDYFTTMGEPILAGRDYDRNVASDLGIDNGQSNIIIDETLAARYGWIHPQDAIGKSIYEPNTGASGATGVPKTVVGVVRSQDLYPIALGIAPGRFYMLGPDHASTVLIRVSKEHVAAGIAAIDEVWQKLAPTVPIKRRFLDEQLEETSARLLGLTRVADLLSYLALCVATLGVVGIATHSINQRLFEIGIRKSLGAGSTRVLVMLLKDFARPIVVANCIAWPLAFVVGKAYLTLFSDPIALTIRPFIASLLVGIAIAWLAIGRQAFRAACINPAKVLRHE
jgi:putative ABC transport system permease protein